MIASRVQQQEKEEGIVYHCKECKYIAETEREATEHEKDKHNSRPCCTVVIKESIKARLREYIRRYWEAKREEAKHSNKRRREREYKEFKDKVYEAFTTFAVRYYSYARSSGALEWNANMLYQFLDNEPISRHDPELATLTWQSLLLLTIPTFPSNRDNGIKVHVIAVEVLQKTNSNQIIAHRRLLKQTIAERISSKYEIDAVTHMVFALEATNNTCNIIDSSDTNIINNEPDKVLQSRPLFSNYVNQEGRLKRLVVGDTRHSLVFVGNNVYDKLLDAMHILSCFYASKSAGMLHDSSLTNKAALKSIMLQRSLQNYYSIRYYGSMDDMYTSKARSETIMNSTLLRHTFLRLLSALIALKEVMKPQIEKLKRYMLEVVGRLTEAIRDIHAKAVQQEVTLLNSPILAYTAKRKSSMVADEVYTARLLKNIIKKLNARLARKQTERDTEAMLEFFARQSKGKVVKEADEKKEISLAAEYSRKGIVREGSEVDYGVNTSVASSVSSKSDDIPIVDEDIPIVEDSILIIEDDIARVDNSK